MTKSSLPEPRGAISLTNVGKCFGSGRPALIGVSLEVRMGELLAVVGGSGSGKTTMLRLMHRLIEPDSGEVRVLDADPSTPPHVFRRQVGYVFQGVGLFPHLTVAENIAITPKLLRWPRGRIEARVSRLLELMELPRSEYGGRLPATLSGGQRQRVGIARALAGRPRVMLMDEPFGALDPITRDDLGRAYRALHDRFGLATVMVTHDITEAILMADRIAVMREGRLVTVGPAAALAVSEEPYVQALFERPRGQLRQMASILEPAAKEPVHG